MTNISLTMTAPAKPLAAARRWIADLYATTGEKLAKHAAYRRDLAQLRSYTDRELNDLGIARSDIKRVLLAGSREA